MKHTPAARSALNKGDVAGALRAMTPEGIEEQLAAGQLWIIRNRYLPKVIHGKNTREQIEKEWGVRFGKTVDDLFVEARFPDGWTMVRAENNSYWIDILDDTGSKRGSLFYKAYYYDRRTQLSIASRYVVHVHRDDKARTSRLFIFDRKTKTEIMQIGTHHITDFETGKTLDERADQWLDDYYPDHNNPFAYWKD